MTRTFDQQYRLTDQTTGTVQDLGFTLDAAGNIDGIADGVNLGLSQGFGQDALHRLTTDAGSYGTKSYSYDGVGNRLSRTHGAATQTLTYTASSNRVTTHDGQTVSLDAAGNTLSNPAESVSFTYGGHNRMLEAYVGGVLKATYGYDGRGQRVKKVETTGAQRTFVYHYGVGAELIGETVYSSAGAKIGERDYVWLDKLPIAQSERVFTGGVVTSSQLSYLHADQLDTPRLATNAAGTVVWRWDSDAFGIGAANQDPDGDTNLVNVRLRFPGQHWDEETGLHYNYFRDYDPLTGRYVESDPVGLDGGLNTYLYVEAGPLAKADPLGLQTPGFRPLALPHGSWGHVQGIRGAFVRDVRVRRLLERIDRQIEQFRQSLPPCEVGYFTLCMHIVPTLWGDLVDDATVSFRRTRSVASMQSIGPGPGYWRCFKRYQWRANDLLFTLLCEATAAAFRFTCRFSRL